MKRNSIRLLIILGALFLSSLACSSIDGSLFGGQGEIIGDPADSLVIVGEALFTQDAKTAEAVAKEDLSADATADAIASAATPGDSSDSAANDGECTGLTPEECANNGTHFYSAGANSCGGTLGSGNLTIAFDGDYATMKTSDTISQLEHKDVNIYKLVGDDGIVTFTLDGLTISYECSYSWVLPE